MALRFTFREGYPLIAVCHHRPLTVADMLPMDESINTDAVVTAYERACRDVAASDHAYSTHEPQGDDRRRATSTSTALLDPVHELVRAIRLVPAIFRLNKGSMRFASTCAAVRIVGMFIQVFSLWQLLRYVSDDAWDDSIGLQIMYALLMAFGAYLQSLMQHNITHEMFGGGLRGRGLICSLVLEKMLCMTPLHRGPARATKPPCDGTSVPPASSRAGAPAASGDLVSTGQLMNFISSDTNAVVEAFMFVVYLGSTCVEAVGAICWTYTYSGWAFACTFAVLLALLPLQIRLGQYMRVLRDKSFAVADQRVRAVTEFLGGITLVKFSAWETQVAAHIEALRQAEEHYLIRGAIGKLLNVAIFFFVPGLLSLTQFGFMTVDGIRLNAVNTFVTTALLQICARTYHMIPRAATSTATAMSAVARIEAFLQIDLAADLAMVDIVPVDDAEATTVEVDGTFGWHGFKLCGIQLKARRGSLTVVVGPVGSGKSTLLHTLLGNCAYERDAATGAALPYVLRRPASVAYVSQEAWIRDGTVRENITFGRAFDEARYRDVLYACSLEDDILQWGGDDVEVGEKGVTLSGGQKQRLSMARACYSDADLYLLDDPISAVDAKVALHLLEVCLRQYLRDKTVILATHHPAPPRFADQLVVLGRGRQEAFGSPRAVMSMLSPSLRSELVDDVPQPVVDAIEEVAAAQQTRAGGASFQRPPRPDVDERIGHGRQLIFLEESAMGSVDATVYRVYLWSSGLVGVAFLLMLLGGQAVRNVAEWWFSAWTSNRFGDSLGTTDYVLVELGLVGTMVVVGIVRAMLYGVMMTNNNTAVHNTMLQHVLQSPMYFFESTPLGRIVNRFGKDLDNADDMLIRMSFDFVQLICVATGALILLIYSVYWFAIVLAIFLVIFGLLFRFYVPSSRYLKRIEATSRSPSIQLFQTTLAGLPVIKVFGLHDAIRTAFHHSLDETTRAIITSDTCQRWIGVRMDWMSVVWATSVGLFVVFLRDTLGPSISGLALSQSLMLTGVLQMGVRAAAETESFMTCVERIVQYGELPEEPNTGTLAPTAEEWPTKGCIEVRGLTVAYASNPTELALRDISFAIGGGEKVAVVGRTGAGKSTLLSTFFRMLPIPEDTILIDGLSTSRMELGLLRSRMGVIPQAPTLFQGSLRYNLDPFGRHSEAEMHEALRKVQLDELVRARGLDADVGEAGGSMSVGQKQLLCAARALLGNPRILFMDEATANVDEATDAAIQRVIREECRNVTVVTIAHRLNTIMDYDKVLVLARGVLVEVGNPLELAARDVADDRNVFAQMVAAMGEDTS